jgi:hypothetical protein
MACLYKRKNSPFWYIRFKDAQGKWKSKPTPYRRDNAQETKEARARCAVNTAQEVGARGITKSEKWESWISDFLATHCKNPVTHQGYEQSWLWLHSYLDEVGVSAPSQLKSFSSYGFNWAGWM